MDLQRVAEYVRAGPARSTARRRGRPVAVGASKPIKAGQQLEQRGRVDEAVANVPGELGGRDVEQLTDDQWEEGTPAWQPRRSGVVAVTPPSQ